MTKQTYTNLYIFQVLLRHAYKMHLTEMGLEGEGQFQLAKDRIQRQALVNMVMNLLLESLQTLRSGCRVTEWMLEKVINL
jgi:hypothetical protein